MSTSNKAAKPKMSFGDRIRKAFMSRDAEAAEQAAKDADELEKTSDEEMGDPDGGESTKTGDAAILKAIQSLDKKFTDRLGALEQRFKDAEPDPENKTDDEEEGETKDDVLEAEAAAKKSEEGEEKYTGDSLQNVLSRAEILSPGIRLPTLDAASKDVGKAVHDCKCKALAAAYSADSGKSAIDLFTGGRSDFDKLPRATVDAAFIGASEIIKQQNNARGVRSGVSTQDFGRAPRTPAEINAANRQYWADRSAKQ